MTEKSYFGANLLRLLAADMQDHMGGQHARPAGRWGWLRPPEGQGKVLWIRAGDNTHDLPIAIQLAGAVRERRRDLRLVFSYEQEDMARMEAAFAGGKKLGFGYGPSEHPIALKRAMRRLAPFRMMQVGGVLGKGLVGQCQKAQVPLLAIHTTPSSGMTNHTIVERAYPRDAQQADSWNGLPPGRVAAAAELGVLLTESQVDPSFRAAAHGSQEISLWWLADLPGGQVQTYVQAWKQSPLSAQGVLFVTEDKTNVINDALSLSQWQRTPFPPGQVVQVDDTQWWPALAASCDAVHVDGAASRALIWQLLAGGRPLTFSTMPSYLQDGALAPTVAANPAEVFQAWSSLTENQGEVRLFGDIARKAFWSERRKAQKNLDALLEHIFAW